MFFGDWLQRRDMLSPNKVALVDVVLSAESNASKVEGLRTGNDNQPITYRELNQRPNWFANFLRDGLGLHRGDRVSIYAVNRVEYVDVLFACNKLGAILHLVNWRLTVRELEAIINDTAPRVLLYSQEFISQVDALHPRLPTVEHFISLDQVTSDQAPNEHCADVRWPTECSNWPKTQPPPVELDWEDPWVICYTGGTTGLPKGTILNYRSIIANSVIPLSVGGCAPTTLFHNTCCFSKRVDSTSSPRRWFTWAAPASFAPALALTSSLTRSKNWD